MEEAPEGQVPYRVPHFHFMCQCYLVIFVKYA